MPSTLQVFDHSQEWLEGPVLRAFSFEELLCRDVGDGLFGSIHFWRHRKACILGMRDRQLPKASQAIEKLRQAGYEVAVRHSGGAAVPLDTGVLNVAMIFPTAEGALSYQDDFQKMADLIVATCRTFSSIPSIEVGEIAGSYCPGTYDLSVEGLKFCGIAQRRQTKANIVHAFILIDGDAEARAHDAKHYYDVASGGDEGLQFPRVEPAKMQSLSRWYPNMTIARFQEVFLELVSKQLNQPLIECRVDWKYPESTLDGMNGVLQTRYDR